MKTNINKVELLGFAGKDAEVREIKDGVKLARFSLATTEGYQTKTGEWINSTTWHQITLWNANAEKAAELVKKGLQVSLTGKIKNRTYETSTGEKKYVTEIEARELEIIPKDEK